MYYLVLWIAEIFNLCQGWKMIKKKDILSFTPCYLKLSTLAQGSEE